jgi:hypothetical protein
VSSDAASAFMTTRSSGGTNVSRRPWYSRVTARASISSSSMMSGVDRPITSTVAPSRFAFDSQCS